MAFTSQTLPKVGECISYVESLGYRLLFRCNKVYTFQITNHTTRPEHNWIMTWTLGEMRNAMKNGC